MPPILELSFSNIGKFRLLPKPAKRNGKFIFGRNGAKRPWREAATEAAAEAGVSTAASSLLTRRRRENCRFISSLLGSYTLIQSCPDISNVLGVENCRLLSLNFVSNN